MRTIKFRAWDTREEKMAPVKTICPGVGATEDDRWGNEGHYFPECRLVLMQYTGLKDKDGKEIYEGDMLKGKPYIEANCTRKGEVVFDNGMFRVVMQNVFRRLDELAEWCEVIGNIYENPDLLVKPIK